MAGSFDFVGAMEAANQETSKLEKTIKRISADQGFLAFRRFLSGHELWASVNKFMGILNIFKAYYNWQRNQNDAMIKGVKSWKDLNDQVGKLKINLKTTKKPFENLLDMADKLGKNESFSDLFQGVFDKKTKIRALGYAGLKPSIKGAITKAFKEVDIYETLVELYGEEMAKTKTLNMLKPLASKNKTSKKLKAQEMMLDAEKNPIAKWFMKKKFALTNMVDKIKEFPWKAFGGSILKAMMWFSLIVLGIFAVKKIIDNSRETFEKIWELMGKGFGFAAMFFTAALEGLGLIIDGIVNGSITDVLWGLVKLFGGIAGGLFTLIGTIILGALVTGFFLVVEGLKMLAKGAADKFGGEAQKWAAIFSLVTSVVTIIGLLAGIISGGWLIAGVVLAVSSALAAVGLASGGVTTGGINLVGEHGPELVSLPSGSRVYSNAESNKMVGGNTNISVHVNGRVGASDAEIRDIANKVAREINLRMNRSTTTGMGF